MSAFSQGLTNNLTLDTSPWIRSMTDAAFSVDKFLTAIDRADRAIISFVSEAGADFERLQQKFDIAFGELGRSAESAFTDLGNALGYSKNSMLDAASSAELMLHSLGLTREEAGQMSEGVVKLATDLAAINNVPIEKTLSAVEQALMGNGRALRTLGIAMNSHMLSQQLIDDGLQREVQHRSQASHNLAEYNDRLIEASGVLHENGRVTHDWVEEQKQGYEAAAIALQQRAMEVEQYDRAAFGQAAYTMSKDKHNAALQRELLGLKAEQEQLALSRRSFDVYAQGLERQAREKDRQIQQQFEMQKLERQYQEAMEKDAEQAVEAVGGIKLFAANIGETTKVLERWNMIQAEAHDYSGAASKMTETWTGTMRMLGAMITDIGSELGTRFNTRILEALKGTDALGESFLHFGSGGGDFGPFKESLTVVLDLFAEVGAEVEASGIHTVRWVGNWIKSLGGATEVIRLVKQGARDAWDTMSGWVSDVGTALRPWAFDLRTIWQNMSDIAAMSFEVAGGMKALTSATSVFGRVFDSVGGFVRSTTKDVKDWTSRLAADYRQWIDDAGGVEKAHDKLLKSMRAGIQEVWDATGEWLHDTTAWMDPYIQDLTDIGAAFYGIAKMIFQVATGSWESADAAHTYTGVVGEVKTKWEQVKDAADAVIRTTTDMAVTAERELRAWIKEMGGVEEVHRKLVEWIKTVARETVLFGTQAKKDYGIVKEAIGDAYKAFTHWVDDGGWDRFSTKLGVLVDGFIALIKKLTELDAFVTDHPVIAKMIGGAIIGGLTFGPAGVLPGAIGGGAYGAGGLGADYFGFNGSGVGPNTNLGGFGNPNGTPWAGGDAAVDFEHMAPDPYNVGQTAATEPGFSLGGPVRGRPGTDSVRAWVSPGEWVVPPTPARQHASFLADITAGRAPNRGVSGGGSTTVNHHRVEQHINLTVNPQGKMTASEIKREIDYLQRMGAKRNK